MSLALPCPGCGDPSPPLSNGEGNLNLTYPCCSQECLDGSEVRKALKRNEYRLRLRVTRPGFTQAEHLHHVSASSIEDAEALAIAEVSGHYGVPESNVTVVGVVKEIFR
jgi:hypothetical protein